MTPTETLALLELAVILLAGIVVVGVAWSVMCDHIDRKEARQAQERRDERTRRMNRYSDEWYGDGQ